MYDPVDDRQFRLTDSISTGGISRQATSALNSSAPILVSAAALSSSFSRVSLSSASAASCPGSNQVNSVNEPAFSTLSNSCALISIANSVPVHSVHAFRYRSRFSCETFANTICAFTVPPTHGHSISEKIEKLGDEAR